MLLRVTHETRYDYRPAVKTAQHMAHLKPREMACQTLVSHSLSIAPQPAQHSELTDVYGNTRAFFSLPGAHNMLTVVADSVVQTSPLLPPANVSITWEQARECLRYRRGAAYDRASQFCFASPYIPRHDDFVAYALPSFTPERPLLEAAQDLMSRIYREFAYESHATEVSTPALESLALRSGVCQDFAHVLVACLRSLGLPARYVSGYLLTQPPPGQPRLVGSDASHAWGSVYVPSPQHNEPGQSAGTWYDLDPTNDRAPGEDYVTLAIGRDYSDVSPLRGVIHGGASHRLRVAVTVAPVDDNRA